MDGDELGIPRRRYLAAGGPRGKTVRVVVGPIVVGPQKSEAKVSAEGSNVLHKVKGELAFDEDDPFEAGDVNPGDGGNDEK